MWLPEDHPLLLAGAGATLSVASLLLHEMGLLGRYRQTHETRSAHGTAAWATPRELKRKGLFGPKGLILGRHGRHLLRLRTDQHILTLAPTRSGKGVSSIIPNLLTYRGSMLVIDPKGENAIITARHRAAMGQKVHVLDPWGITGLPTACFNPFDALDPLGRDLGEDASLIAEALVQSVNVGEGDNFWTEEARALVSGLVLHIATSVPDHLRNLPHLRALLTQGPKEFQDMLTGMSKSPAAGGLVARAGNRMRQKADKEFSGVVSSAQSQTHFLDSDRLAPALRASSFSLSDLKQKPTTIYLVLPAKRLPTHGRWLRLLVAMALNILASEAAPPPLPVLFLLDEFAALGHLSTIETAMGLMAGFGLQLWPILQDLPQLRALYPERWESFIANANIQTFAVSEPGTAEYLSKMLGQRTVTVRTETGITETKGQDNYSRVGRALLMPDELRRLPDDQQLLFLRGLPPALTGRVRYYADPEFDGLFDANPFVGGDHGTK